MPGRSPTRRCRTGAGVVAIALLSVFGLGCSGDDGGPPAESLPVVDRIDDAVDAVVDELGPDVEFFEINADRMLVNLFVAVDAGTAAVAYVFLDGELQPPAPPRTGASGFTFGPDELEFDADRVLARITDELPGSTVTTFVLLGTPEGGVRREVLVQSRQGGVLAVEVGPDGAVLAVDPL